MFRKFIFCLNGFILAGVFLKLSENEKGVVCKDKFCAWEKYIRDGTISPLFEQDAPFDGEYIDLQKKLINRNPNPYDKHCLQPDLYRKYYEKSRLEHCGIPTTTIEPCDLEGALCWLIVAGLNYRLTEGMKVANELPDGLYLLKLGPKCYCANLCVIAFKENSTWRCTFETSTSSAAMPNEAALIAYLTQRNETDLKTVKHAIEEIRSHVLTS